MYEEVRIKQKKSPLFFNPKIQLLLYLTIGPFTILLLYRKRGLTFFHTCQFGTLFAKYDGEKIILT